MMDDDELHDKNPPTPCLWQAPASTQKTKRKTARRVENHNLARGRALQSVARELWRLQHADVAEADARFDAFVSLHPSASYEDLAGVAGGAIAPVWADAAAFRSSNRCAQWSRRRRWSESRSGRRRCC